jgi:rhodanese-related sulfurtransferase
MKIIGILLFVILLTPFVSGFEVFANDISNESLDNQNLEEELSIKIFKSPSFSGVNLEIKNVGNKVLSDIEWSFRSKAAITGTGIFINEKLQTGKIDEIQSDKSDTLEFRPFNSEFNGPFGIGNIYLNASAKVDETYVRTQQRAIIIGFSLFVYKDTYMDIKPDEAYQRYLDNEFDLIIDVVGLDIYNNGHLPGAVNYVWADGTLNEKISDLDPSLTYLVYCHTDPPSTASAQALVNEGFDNIYRLEGNFVAWKNAGYPIET